MTGSVSGKDEPNPVLWLATQADKMALGQYSAILTSLLRCDWLPERARWRLANTQPSWSHDCAVIGYPSGQDGAWPILSHLDLTIALWVATRVDKMALGQYSAILISRLQCGWLPERTRWRLANTQPSWPHDCAVIGYPSGQDGAWPIPSHLDLTIGQLPYIFID